MLSLIIYVLAVAVIASGQHCDDVKCNEAHIHFNEERLCVPVKGEGHCCPTSFNCPPVEAEDNSKCHVRGHAYDIGTQITSEQVGDKCIAECTCIADGVDDTHARLECARIECPEDLGLRPPQGCSYTYSHDNCCHTGTTCDNVTDGTPFTCQHGNHTHRIGEKFHPDEHPCQVCICTEGFDGTVKEPWCKPVNCGFQAEHKNEGCAPIYLPGRCCPVGWRCPNESEDKTVSSISPPASDDPICVHGTHRQSVGDKVTWEGSCIECNCSMPPHLSCEQKVDCIVSL